MKECGKTRRTLAIFAAGELKRMVSLLEGRKEGRKKGKNDRMNESMGRTDNCVASCVVVK
jgi:hypothetical protein